MTVDRFQRGMEGYSTNACGVSDRTQITAVSEFHPEILILQIVRWDYQSALQQCQKNVVPVEVDESIAVGGCEYEAVGVLYHHGLWISGGHYTAALKDITTKSWVLTDDSKVTNISEQEALRGFKSEACVAIYKKAEVMDGNKEEDNGTNGCQFHSASINLNAMFPALVNHLNDIMAEKVMSWQIP